MECRRRTRLRRFMGSGAEDRRTKPVAAVLCRAALWWRAGRGDVDGIAADPSGEGHRRHEATREKRAALPDRALWYSKRRARRHGCVLRQELVVTNKNGNRHGEASPGPAKGRTSWLAQP